MKFGRRHLGIECTLAEWSADGMTWDNDLGSKGEEIGKSIVASEVFYALPITQEWIKCYMFIEPRRCEVLTLDIARLVELKSLD